MGALAHHFTWRSSTWRLKKRGQLSTRPLLPHSPLLECSSTNCSSTNSHAHARAHTSNCTHKPTTWPSSSSSIHMMPGQPAPSAHTTTNSIARRYCYSLVLHAHALGLQRVCGRESWPCRSPPLPPAHQAPQSVAQEPKRSRSLHLHAPPLPPRTHTYTTHDPARCEGPKRLLRGFSAE